MPSEHPSRNEAGGPPKHRRLQKILLFAAVAIVLGYLVGSLNDPFLLILYGQLAFFLGAVVLILRIKPNLIALGLVILIIVAQALRQREISVVLGFLLLVQLAVLGWKRGPGWRKAVWISGSLTAAAIGLGLIFLPHKPAHARPAADPTAAAAAFESLPYLSHVDHKADKKDGVLVYDPAAASPGLNLYNSYYKAGAYLLDMAGDVIHTWLPQGSPDHWQFVAVCANGDLLVCIEHAELMRLDWASRILWRKPMRIHHEIAVADNQDIYTLTSREEVVRIDSLPVPLIDDYVVILSPQGVVKKQISLFHVLERQLSALNAAAIYLQVINPPDLFWRVIKAKLARGLLLPRVTSFDPFHTNSISILDRDVPGLGRRGNVLVSMRSLDLIGIVDLETETLTWAWGPGESPGAASPDASRQREPARLRQRHQAEVLPHPRARPAKQSHRLGVPRHGSGPVLFQLGRHGPAPGQRQHPDHRNERRAGLRDHRGRPRRLGLLQSRQAGGRPPGLHLPANPDHRSGARRGAAQKGGHGALAESRRLLLSSGTRYVQMKAAVLTGVRSVEVRDLPDPKIQAPDEVLLRTAVAGLCGSDLHYFIADKVGSETGRLPGRRRSRMLGLRRSRRTGR